MTKEQFELLLSVARLLRSHLSDHHNANFKHLPDDLEMLRLSLKPFESNIVDLQSNGKFEGLI